MIIAWLFGLGFLLLGGYNLFHEMKEAPKKHRWWMVPIVIALDIILGSPGWAVIFIIGLIMTIALLLNLINYGLRDY